MARTAIPVKKSILMKCLQEAEAEKTFPTRDALWEDVAARYNEKTSPAISKGVVYLRVRDWKLEVKTAKGKRGGNGEHLRGINRGPRTSRAEKFAGNPAIVESLRNIRAFTIQGSGDRFLPVVEKIEQGSMKAAVKLKCLECANYQTIEIRECLSSDCPLYPFRPYQTGKLPVDIEEQVEEVA